MSCCSVKKWRKGALIARNLARAGKGDWRLNALNVRKNVKHSNEYQFNGRASNPEDD